MILQCSDLDRALRTPELMPDMRAHAEECPACAEQLHLWEEISRVAPGLRQEWESPFLWQRIGSLEKFYTGLDEEIIVDSRTIPLFLRQTGSPTGR